MSDSLVMNPMNMLTYILIKEKESQLKHYPFFYVVVLKILRIFFIAIP